MNQAETNKIEEKTVSSINETKRWAFGQCDWEEGGDKGNIASARGPTTAREVKSWGDSMSDAMLIHSVTGSVDFL